MYWFVLILVCFSIASSQTYEENDLNIENDELGFQVDNEELRSQIISDWSGGCVATTTGGI